MIIVYATVCKVRGKRIIEFNTHTHIYILRVYDVYTVVTAAAGARTGAKRGKTLVCQRPPPYQAANG